MTEVRFERRIFTMRDGVELVADAYGEPEAPAVVLSHGGGQTRHSWRGTAKALAEKGWYTLAYDHRGHSESGWSADGDYAVSRFAEDQARLIAELGAPAVVIGASLGGISGMLVEGELAPGSLSALVLVDITPNMNPNGADRIMTFMHTGLEEGFESLDEVADAIASYTGRERRPNSDGLLKNLRVDENGRYRWHWDPNFLNQRFHEKQLPQRLDAAVSKIDAPMLLVRGMNSDIVTEEGARAFLEKYPGCAFADVKDARHMVAGDRNDIFTNEVSQFLSGLPFAP